MTEKPLNLSILIGDMNRLSPQSSPRQILLNPTNKKSRIPLATSPTLPGHELRNNIRGVTTFRQWADPPPPPPRSRTMDRRSATPKKRPGSADPRFRSLQDTKSNVREVSSYIPQLDRMDKKIELYKPIMPYLANMEPVEIRHAHLRDLSPSSPDNSPRNNSPRNNSPLNNSPLNNSPRNNSPRENLSHESSPRDISPRENSPGKNSPQELFTVHNRPHLRSTTYEPANDNIKNFEDVMSVFPIPPPYLQPKELEIKEIFGNVKQCDVTSESKYSQTEVYSTDYQQDSMTEIGARSESTEDCNNEADILQFIARNYEKTSKFLDGIVLNRTRSISSGYELEPVISSSRSRACKSKRSYGRVSRILLQQNYWTYVEIWAALSFLAAILMFGWFYLVPYIFDAFYSWVFPEPIPTPLDYYRLTFSEIYYSTVDQVYNLLTTPANRRLS